MAHAMMSDPEILVLDEPTLGLDPNQIVEIRDIIKRIGGEKTIILSTHILSEAEATCDRIMIISRGKIVADSSTESLKQAASGESLIDISLKNASAAPVQEELGSIDGILSLGTRDDEEGVLHVRLTCRPNIDPREQIYRKIKRTKWVLLELRQETKSLEKVFRELTREQGELE